LRRRCVKARQASDHKANMGDHEPRLGVGD
jgi:hypothetical protein